MSETITNPHTRQLVAQFENSASVMPSTQESYLFIRQVPVIKNGEQVTAEYAFTSPPIQNDLSKKTFNRPQAINPIIMSNQKPTVGRIVLYNPSTNENTALAQLGNNSSGQMPAIITSVWSDECVNLKVMIDGNHPDLWRTSVLLANNPGQQMSWEWPKRV